MQKLFVHILAILRRIFPSNPAIVSQPAPQEFRRRQVARAPEPKVYLKILSAAERRTFGPLLSASLGTIVVAGFTGPAMAQGEQSCAWVYELRSPYTVERVLTRYPSDPCIPALIEALPPQLLSRIDVNIIANLPASQLRKVDSDILQDLGITTRGVSRDDYGDDDDDDDGGY